MKTACFFHYTGPGRISIARFAPRSTPGGFRVYQKLAPHRYMLKLPEEEYRRIFFGEILAGLDAAAVWRELHQMVHPAEPVLLCWEHLHERSQSWCHRTMVAEWFLKELGLRVVELPHRHDPEETELEFLESPQLELDI
jgi:hypothetical protein